MLCGRREYGAWGEIEQMDDEIVRMLRLDSKVAHDLCREVSKVHRDDHVGLSADGGGQDMPIVWVGQMKTGNQIFVARCQRVHGT